MKFLQGSVRDVTLSLILALVAGCGPNDGLRDLAKARDAFARGELAKADECVSKSLKVRGGDVAALVTGMRIKMALGEIESATVLADNALALEPKAVDVRTLAAQTAFHAHDFAKAIGLYESIVAERDIPASVRSAAYAGLGVVRASDNSRDLALLAYLMALRLDRRNPAAWYHLGLLYRDAFGYREAALEQFNCYVRLDKVSSPRVQKVQRTVIPALQDEIRAANMQRCGSSRRDSAASAAFLREAERAMGRGNWKTAKQKYQAALDADALSAPAAIGLARAFEKTDASRDGVLKALECYRRACMLKPLSVSLYVSTAELAVKVGRNATALEIYSRAVAADPSNLSAIDGLIRCQRKAGNSSVASAYQRYRDLVAAKR